MPPPAHDQWIAQVSGGCLKRRLSFAALSISSVGHDTWLYLYRARGRRGGPNARTQLNAADCAADSDSGQLAQR